MDSFDEFAAAVGEGADGSDEDAVVSVTAVSRIAVSEGKKMKNYIPKSCHLFFYCSRIWF